MKSKAIFIIALFFMGYNAYSQNEYISRIRVKVRADACGLCNHQPIKDVYYGYTDETRIRDIITSWNYYPYDVWHAIYVTTPATYRILRWYDPVEGEWVKWIFTPDTSRTLTRSYHGSKTLHDTWLDAEVDTYDPVRITNVQCGGETGYMQCVDDINANITFTLKANNVSPSASLYIKAYDENDNLISSVYAGSYASSKTFTFSSFNLQNYWGKMVKFVITTGIFSEVLSSSTASYVFTTPFPEPAISKTKPYCKGDSNGSITLTFPATDISRYTITITNLIPRIPGHDCGSNDPSTYPGYCLGAEVTNVTSTNSSITLPNLSAGAYEVNAEANSVSHSCVKTFFIELLDPPELVLDNASAKNSYGNDPSYQIKGHKATDTIEINLNGGHPPYRYSIDDGAHYSEPTSNTTYLYSGVGAGYYTIRVKDNHNCDANRTIPVPMAEPYPVTITGLAVNTVSCHTGNTGTHDNGRIQFEIKGGIGPYDISLGTVSNIVSPQDDNYVELEGLSAGDYKVFVRDKYISGRDSAINVPSHTLLGFNTITAADKHWPNCIGGSDGYLKVSGYGGKLLPAMNYKFGLINGSDTTWAGDDFIRDLRALQPYTIVIKDGLNCRAVMNNVVIPQNPNPLKLILEDTIPPACYNFNNGKAIFTGANGSPYFYGYDFTLKNVNTGKELEENTHRAQFEGLTRGTYEIRIKDSYDCEINDYYRDTIFINEPDRIVIKDSVRQVSRKGLHNGYIQAIFFGGNKKYRYEWYSGLSASSDRLIKAGTTTDTALINNVGAGDYLLRVQDTCGCNNGAGDEAWLEWATRISEPAHALSFVVKEHKNVSCNDLSDGRLIVEGTGGWGNNYRYGLQIDQLSYDGAFNNLRAGLYTIYVVDEQNEIFYNTVEISEPGKLTASLASATQAGCYGNSDGSFALSVSGGTQPYFISTDNNLHKIQETGISGLEAGLYDVLVTDSNQCQATLQVTILQPGPLAISPGNLVQTSCGEPSGEISVTCSGGTPGYSYRWLDTNNELKGITSSIKSLPAGIYQLTLTDANGCSKLSDWYTIANSDGPQITETKIDPVSCFGYSDGKARISVEKGIPPYTYRWSDGQVTESAMGLQSGIYFVTVTDHDNCTNTASVKIPSPAQLTLVISAVNDPQCHDYSNGSVSVSGQGGTVPYRYTWDNGLSGESLSGLKAGSYAVTITDFNGCTNVLSVQLDNPDPVSLDLGGQTTICGGQTVTLDAGSFAAYNWNSDNGFTSKNRIVNLSRQGNYYLEVTDSHGCTGKDEFRIITSNSLLNADFLIRSEAFTGDTVVAVDISWPLPESTYWVYDKETIKNFSAPGYESLVFTRPGTYLITMYATLGECRDNYSREITIKANNDIKGARAGEKEPLIQKFLVRPNPNNGNFTAEIELREENDITLRLFGNSLLTDSKKLKGLSSYTVEYNLQRLSPGIYILYLTAGNEHKHLKVIIY